MNLALIPHPALAQISIGENKRLLVGGVEILLLLALLVFLWIGIRRWSGSRQFSIVWIVCLGLILGMALVVMQMPISGALVITARTLLGVCLMFFLVWLYRKWIGGDLTPEEQLPGAIGFKAWLQGKYLILPFLMAVMASVGFQYSLLASSLLLLLALLAYPIFKTVQQSGTPGSKPPDGNHREERRRVITLLEAGRITSDEAADLLNALSSRVEEARSSSHYFSGRRWVLVGLILVMIGFFLPWYSMPAGRLIHNLDGGDMRYGLGWILLLCSALVAVLPWLMNGTLNSRVQHSSYALVAVAAFIAIYLFADAPRFVSAGLVLAIAGVCFQGFGLCHHLIGKPGPESMAGATPGTDTAPN